MPAAGHVCERCRVLRSPDGACARCGGEATLALAPAARAAVALTDPPRLAPGMRLFCGLFAIPLLVAMIGGFLARMGGARAGWYFLLIGLPATGLLWSAFTGRNDGFLPFLRLPGAILRRLRRAPLRLPAAAVGERARAGVIAAPPGEVVARLEAWFLPGGDAPFAWQASTGGFAVALDDGTAVDVPPGPLGVDVPDGHPRRLRRRRIGGDGPRGLLVAVEILGGQRVRLDAELVPADAAQGYREPARRFTLRGVPTLALLPQRP